MLRSSRTGPTKIGSLTRASAVIVGALVALFGVVAGPLLGVFATSASAATTGSGYTAITPYRALGSAAAGVDVVAGTPDTVQITSSTAGEVPAGATAVVLDVTASAPTSAGYLEVYPAGAAPAAPTSNVNFVANETVANLVTVPLSAAGGITVLNSSGTTAVDVDVEGFYSTSGLGLYNAITPVRASGANGTSIGSGATTAFTVTGATVPTTATAVVVNLTASAGTGPSYLTAYAAGVANPPTATSSSLNFVAGQTVANRDIVNVGTAGQIEVYNFNGTVNVDVDVDGYYAATGGAFVPLAAPFRVTDTRSSNNGTPVASGGTEAFNLATTASGIPASASAVAANFTVVPNAAPSAPGYITVYPTGVATTPNASDVNWPANSGPVANFTQAGTAGTTPGSAEVYNLNSGSPIDLVIDDFGYFTGITSGVAVVATPATISTASGSTSAIVATVTNAGTPVATDPIAVTTTPSAAGACGATSGVPTTTNGSGVASFTYTGTAVVGTCTIKVTEADHTLSGTTVVTQAANNAVAINGTAGLPATVLGGSTTAPHTVAQSTGTGVGQQNIFATVTNPAGTAVAGDTVNFTLTPLTTGGCGSLSLASAATATNGTATTVYTTPFVTGLCSITATEATAQTGESAAATTSVVIDSVVSTTPALDTLALTPLSANLAPGATQTLTAKVALTASPFTPVVGDPILLTPTGTTGSLNTLTGVTGAGGTVTFTYTAGSTGGATSIAAVEANWGIADAAPAVYTTVLPTNNAVTVVATPASLVGNGTSTSSVTATVTAAAGGPVVGDILGFSLTPSVTGACGTITPAAGQTNSSGSVTIAYTSSAVNGFCTVTATESAAVSPELTAQSGATQITQHS